ncbi:MAG: 3-isopropylmalate dehydratase large subunit [Candidatus Krumholzibacteriota bacterium]|nr:3-isopropylmalate dehydratase large subunit [Candidatus Krumholzibacteriota bacterium]
MGKTLIEKIIAAHGGPDAAPGDIVDLEIDVRLARDFGGANVVKNLEEAGLGIDEPARTFFTFDCNPTGSDQKYAANQQRCRLYARREGIKVFDIHSGIGTHVAIEHGLAVPGGTLVSTDSHANIMGAIGAFGQGLGDVDMAHVFAFGRTWFRVPPTIKLVLEGEPSPLAGPKDVVLAILAELGAAGLLGHAAEIHGPFAEGLDLDDRVTIASMGTEMGAIIVLFPPSRTVLDYCRVRAQRAIEPVLPDADARYARTVAVDLDGLGPMVSRPGHPDDAVAVDAVAGRKIDSAFIGSCTNGRISDLREAAAVLAGRRVAPGVVLKIVPATDAVWRQALDEGLIDIFKRAGALVGNAGCAGCAAGQIGMNGPGEVTVSTGNRNFTGKQGKGEVFLAGPATVAASAVSGVVTHAGALADEPVLFVEGEDPTPRAERSGGVGGGRPTVIEGRVWVIRRDNIDTDMIFHNRYLTITDPAEMGQYAFDNLEGWEDFAKRVRPGDIVVTGANFGAGSSRQQAVDCFKALGVPLIVARSYGAIYERNAVNAGLPILSADLVGTDIADGERIRVDLAQGLITRADGSTVRGAPFSGVQLEIYQRGGLLAG